VRICPCPSPMWATKGQTISLREIIGRLPYMRATVTQAPDLYLLGRIYSILGIRPHHTGLPAPGLYVRPGFLYSLLGPLPPTQRGLRFLTAGARPAVSVRPAKRRMLPWLGRSPGGAASVAEPTLPQ
jgi:hypothetical protein